MRTFFILILLSGLLSVSTHAQASTRDSLRVLIKTMPEDTSKVAVYLAYGYMMEDVDLDSAAWYYERAGMLSEQLQYVAGTLGYLRNYTFVLNMQGKLEEAYRLNLKGLRLARLYGFPVDEAKALNNLASSHNYQGAYDSAIVYYLESVRAFEAMGQTQFLGLIYQNITAAFDALGQYERAVEYGWLCVRQSLAVGDSTTLAAGLVNVGGSLSSLHLYDSATAVLTRAIEVAERLGYVHGAHSAWINLGDVHAKRRQHEEAEAAFGRALELARRLKYPSGQAISLSGLARVHFEEGRFLEAEKYATEALVITEAQPAGAFTDLRQQYKLMADIKAHRNKVDEAYRYLKKYVVLDDSLSGDDVRRITADLERKYQLAKKEGELAQNQLELEQVQNTVRSRNTQVVLLIVGLVLAMALMFVLFRYFRDRQSLQKQELLALQREQEVMRLRANVEGQQEERRRISREMHDDIGSGLTSLVFLANSLVHNGDGNGVAAQVASLARQLVMQMNEVVWSLNSEQDTLEDLVIYIRRNIGEMLDMVGMKYMFEIPPSIPRRTITGIERRNLYLVVKEAVHNGIKHAGATQMVIRMDFSEGIRVTISDDGKGLNGDTAHGNGLRNMRYRMEQIGGSWRLTSQNPVEVELSLPASL